MADHVIPDEDGKGMTFAFIGKDVEYVNPIEYYKERFIKSRTVIYTQLIKFEMPFGPGDIMEKVARKNAENDWSEEYAETTATEIPKNLIALLNSTSKKEQVDLLKGQTLTSSMLFSLIYKAFNEYGYSYSTYSGEQYPSGLDRSSLPKFATLNRETGEIKKNGKTSLTDGQIKQAILQRNRTIAKFLDKGSDWHCFIITYKSIGGEERAHQQAHFHYFSDKWTIPREEAVKQIRNGSYPTSKIHIDILDYGNQTNNT